ncbi:MAG TPA: bis-aminopropyl spermidine synthase family protein [Actinomycetota bacterium]|nr:bis-aminopropyl spermidine synthase family protein [Actinomycetota bacterium]
MSPRTALGPRLAQLEAEAGVTFGEVRRLLCALALSGDPSVPGLVEETGVPHRRVLEILRSLSLEVSGKAVVVDDEDRDELRRRLGCSDPPDTAAPPATPAADRALEIIEEVSEGLPPSVWSLDHVPATPATILQRARYLADRHGLKAAHLVCLGDHDLTAVAAKLLVPEAAVSVVDIDERLLEYLDAVGDRLGLGLRLYDADLRLGLPRTLGSSADLVFTDPPYTAEGVELFLRRGVEALAERPGARLLFCHGAGDQGEERLLAVQAILVRLHVALDALLPGFNRYRAAHAIGAASSLWVCRPTRRTRAAAAAGAGVIEARIYSRGRASRESAGPAIDGDVLGVVKASLGEARGTVGFVGDGWEDLAAGRPAVRVGLDDLVEAATEPPHHGHRRAWPNVLVVNLDRFYGASLARVLMGAPQVARLLVVVDGRAAGILESDPVKRLIGARYAVQLLRSPQAGAPGVLSATPAPAQFRADRVGWVLRYLQEHQDAKLRNAWREALCGLASRLRGSCTKNEARALVDDTAMRAWELDAHLLDLPRHRLAALVAAVESTVATLPGGATAPAPPASP